MKAPVLRFDDARKLIDQAVPPIAERSRVPLVDALDRILASDLVSAVDVPAHDNAAMDGYAMAEVDSRDEWSEIGSAHAGRPYDGPVAAGHCIRIMTGAVMPAGCDTVVPWEDADVHAGRVRLKVKAIRGQHVRPAGEDIGRATVVLQAGRRVTPADIGLAASIGEMDLDVVRRARVAVFSTGDELRAIDQPLDDGSIRDSNRFTLIAMLRSLGFETFDLGIVRDDPDALEAALLRACRAPILADAIITSGGVSAGDADHTRAVMSRLGDVAFWQLAIKPGRPMAFGRLAPDGRPVLLFGLPGNPVAVMVVFQALVRDALLKLGGALLASRPSLTLVCDTPIDKSAGRTEFVRGIAFRAHDGWHVRTTGSQGSGILRSMSEANCLVVLDHDRGAVTAGETVEAWPFEGLF